MLYAKQPLCKFLGGRGSGKSVTIAGKTRIGLAEMPRAKCFFASTTYNQIATKTLPAVIGKLEEMGIHEGIHYVIGIKPPKHFEKPFSPPKRYENVMSYINGYCIEFLSLDRPDLARGGSYDGGNIDEDQNLKQEPFTKVLLPSVRGNLHRFSHWSHQQVNLYGSMPWKPSGYWVLEYQEKALAHPDDYFFVECSARDNIGILGEAWFQRMKRELPYLEYLVEIENQRITKIPDGFYHKFDADRNGYTPLYNYTNGNRGIQSLGPADVRTNELIEVSFDFGGWFNCMTCYQERDNIERLVRRFWAKDDDKINELIDKFCKYFGKHEFKYVRIWGEPRGHDKREDGDTIYEQVVARFKENGWQGEVKVEKERATTDHLERHHFINEVMEGSNPIYPQFQINVDECKDTIIAIQTAPIKADFTKDKGKEKQRNFPQEHATHQTDTIDYYLYQKHGWKKSGRRGRGAGGML